MKQSAHKAILMGALALLGLAASQPSPFGARLEAAVRSGGEPYAQVLSAQDQAQRLCTQHRSQIPGALLPQFLQEQKGPDPLPQGRHVAGRVAKRGKGVY